MTGRFLAFAAALFVSLIVSLIGPRAVAADFYSGKTITIIVGSDAGGGFDAFARAVARHLGKQIQGNPNVVVENMPGAGSAKAAGYLSSVAPRDGTVIGALNPGGLLTPLFDNAKLNFDPTKLQFLGSADSGSRLCISFKGSRIKTFADAQNQEAMVGAAAVGSSSSDYAYLHRAVQYGKFKIVAGYKGMADILLAMERKEVDMVCGEDWSSITAERPQLVANGGLNYLLKVTVQDDPALDKYNIPEARDLSKTDLDKAVTDLVGGQQLFGRPYAIAPGVPAERLAILRKAFMATLADKEFLTDANNIRLVVTPVDGEKIQTAVQKIFAAPPEVIAAARKAVRP